MVKNLTRGYAECYNTLVFPQAEVAELADAADSKSAAV